MTDTATHLRTGAAAKALGVSSHVLRRLADAGLIEAEVSDGGQWRFAAEEIGRLKSDGLPALPAANPATSAGPGRKRDSQLLGPPSKELIEAAEDVRTEELGLRGLQAKRAQFEAHDWFADRADRQRALELERLERQHQLEIEHERIEREHQLAREKIRAAQEQTRWAQQVKREAEARYRAWFNGWLDKARERLPYGTPVEVKAAATAAVSAALEQLAPESSSWQCDQAVVAAIETTVSPWRSAKETAKAIEQSLQYLPYPASDSEEWVDAARAAAAAAIGEVDAEATEAAKLRAATRAVRELGQQFEQQRERQRLAEVRSMDLGAWSTDEDKEQAAEELAEVFGELPPDAGAAQLEKARKQVLGRHAQQIERRRRESDRDQQIRSTVDNALYHVAVALNEYEFDSALERLQTQEQLTNKARGALRRELRHRRSMDGDEIREFIEGFVADELADDFVDVDEEESEEEHSWL